VARPGPPLALGPPERAENGVTAILSASPTKIEAPRRPGGIALARGDLSHGEGRRPDILLDIEVAGKKRVSPRKQRY